MLPDNPLRGEASVEIRGQFYTLTYDVSAFITAQQATGMKMSEMINGFSEQPDDLIQLRALFWAGLQKKHALTIGEAESLMSDAGIVKTRVAVSNGLSAALGEKEGGDGENPPEKAKAGTG